MSTETRFNFTAIIQEISLDEETGDMTFLFYPRLNNKPAVGASGVHNIIEVRATLPHDAFKSELDLNRVVRVYSEIDRVEIRASKTVEDEWYQKSPYIFFVTIYTVQDERDNLLAYRRREGKSKSKKRRSTTPYAYQTKPVWSKKRTLEIE